MFSMLLNRDITQAASLFLMMTGIVAILGTDFSLLGIGFIGSAIWIMVISESFYLTKIQVEMQSALEDMGRKRAMEVEEVLFFLRQSQIACSPFESLDGAKRLCRQVSQPSMVMTTDYQIINANKHMHDVLGWEDDSLIGVPAYTINIPIVMSKIGEYASKPDKVNEPSIVTYYAYSKKCGEIITGLMMASKVGREGFFVKFIPSSELALTRQQVEEMVVKNV